MMAHWSDTLREFKVELVVLAGFMRIVTPILLDAFPNRVMNIHPALLPAFPGLDAQKQTFGVWRESIRLHCPLRRCRHGYRPDYPADGSAGIGR